MRQSDKQEWQPWRPGYRPLTPGLARVIGHRGARDRAPENTLAGIRKARELGATWVEFDVMLTGDDVPVLLHDETLDRTTDGHGPLAEKRLEELAGVDAGRKFDPAFAGESIPTLAATIELLLELSISANLEIKPSTGREALTGRIVAEALQAAWPATGPRLLVSSFSMSALEAARRVSRELVMGLLVEEVPSDWAERMSELACTTLHPDQASTTPEQVSTLVESRVPVLLYTVNEPARARSFLEAGAAGVITDVPDLILPVA